MPSNATINRAAHVISAVRPGMPADRALREEFIANRRMPEGERRVIVDAVFTYFRWVAWLNEKDSIQAGIKLATDLQRRFDAEPLSIKDATLAASAVPPWVLDAIDFGAGPAGTDRRNAWVRSLQSQAPLWIRARPSQSPILATALGDCAPPPEAYPLPCPDALRYTGRKDLFKTPEFQDGRLEIQDIASQAVGAECAPKPGETWWDACAGEGGKSLHLADQMANKGVVWCTDRSARRADVLKRRFSRAGLFNYRLVAWDGTERLPTKTKFDGILLDAPCSGVGTWRRKPDARWTMTPDDVAELAGVQRRMLEAVAGSLKRGGRLVYSVCTMTRAETTSVAAAFGAAHPELEPVAVAGAPEGLTLWPHEASGNGMFIAAWKRRQRCPHPEG